MPVSASGEKLRAPRADPDVVVPVEVVGCERDESGVERVRR